MDHDAHILIVDDEEAIRRLLTTHLSNRGYHALEAADGLEALRVIAEEPVDLVLSDIRMPGMTGMELLRTVRRSHDDIAFVLLTGCDDVPVAVEAMQVGALDYLVKPARLQQVTEAVSRALATQKRMIADRLASFEIAGQVGVLGERLERASFETLELLVAVLDARERETMYHSKRVSESAVQLGQALGVTGADLELLRRAALLHDVGKVGVPDAILGKPGELTPEERAEMSRHPQIGYRILQAVEALRPAAEIVLAHHAHYDGSGYPVSWRGDRIPLGARIFAVVDTFDAMTSDRPYHEAQSYEEARREIARCAGTQFDPAVVAAFESIPPETWEEIHRRIGGEASGF